VGGRWLSALKATIGAGQGDAMRRRVAPPPPSRSPPHPALPASEEPRQRKPQTVPHLEDSLPRPDRRLKRPARPKVLEPLTVPTMVKKAYEEQSRETKKQLEQGRELLAEVPDQKIAKNNLQVNTMRFKKELAKKKESYELLKKKLEELLRANPLPSSEKKQEVVMRLEGLKRQKAAMQEMEEKLHERFEELSHYDLEDPQDFADFVTTANIRLVRAEYLY